tara:strand:+ start:381 stop:830 length:450 start_codon:yes stop_codon:yes gene_type:complete
MKVFKRTLTPKSKWEFSRKYQGYTIQQLLEFHPITVYWGYCHLEKIDYNEEILTFLKDKYKDFFVEIEKPNIDKEQFQSLLDARVHYNDMSYERLKNLITYRKIRAIEVTSDLLDAFRDKKSKRIEVLTKKSGITKGSLQRKNQGHTIK